MFNNRERELERITGYRDIGMKEIYDLKKEFQEFKAVVEEREKLKDRMWTERLTFLGLLIASWAITIGVLLHLVGVF
jgi:hypothetical protein